MYGMRLSNESKGFHRHECPLKMGRHATSDVRDSRVDTTEHKEGSASD